MKKVIAIILALVVVMSMSACSTLEEQAQEIVDRHAAENAARLENNPMLILVGDSIEINGTTYTAAMISDYQGNPYVTDAGSFVVNRINGNVYLSQTQVTSYSSRAYTVTSLTYLGMVYTGTITIGNETFNIPENPTN